MFISMTATGIYLKVKNRESRLIFWAALIIICGGLTGLQVIVEKALLPYLSVNGEEYILRTVTIFAGILNFTINTFPYYSILIFFLFYNGYFINSKWIQWVLCVPLIITFLFQTNLQSDELNEWFVAIWGVFYVIASVILAIRPLSFEKRRAERMYHYAIAVIFLVPIACLNIYHFLPSIYSDQLLRIFPVICIFSILITLFFYIRGTFLGVKRRKLQGVHVGTTLVQHSLKNSIGKIKLNAFNIRKSLKSQQADEIDQYVENLLRTHEEMMQTISQIAYVVNDRMIIKKQMYDLSILLDEVVEMIEDHPKIHVESNYYPVQVCIDRKLVTECILNICNNAIDAMKEEGTIQINLEQKKRKIILSISDTGLGMNPIEIQNVYEPFYSTKQRTGKNFGLGMFQVKKIIDAHKGKIEIASKPGKGTTISLIFRKQSKGFLWRG